MRGGGACTGGLALALAVLAACSAPQQQAPARSMDAALEGYGYQPPPPDAAPGAGADGGNPFTAARPPLMDVDIRIQRWAVAVAPPRQTRAVGHPWGGALAQPAELPVKGPGYTTFKPHRFGTWQLIHTFLAGIAEVQLRHPDTVPVVVGDLSTPGGGHLRPHRSHQNGLDIDVGYFHGGNAPVTRFQVATDGSLDAAKTLTMIEGFLRTGWTDVMFVDRQVQQQLLAEARARGWSDHLQQAVFEVACDKGCRQAVIRHSKGHHNHLHLRVRCDPTCDKCP